MIEDVVIEMMGDELILWRCLHGGPITAQTIDTPRPNKEMNWEHTRSRNLPLMKKLTQLYGACAVIARDDKSIVGMLRFYPKEICLMAQAGMLCLQQNYPYGPADDFADTKFPASDEIADRTLVVHCMMTGEPSQKHLPYQRKGLGTWMVKKLIEWARQNGWTAVEATAYEDLPLIYKYTGQAGKGFWEKLGFAIVHTGIETALDEEMGKSFALKLKEEAVMKGLTPENVRNKYTMRLGL